ncbi:hypothetical protein CBR_g28543 [Chara braunii]|uniref:Uncharacterized protein n=1 Tax=Chara braunii TaxID=69332 RepID=A0A388JW93_CHABU|nr:hypothetical protein CBR_g28543 [Chara braunii]|eukprot:GBG62066.1 hypothetical protein CBR_g28543 [Chara braunii]
MVSYYDNLCAGCVYWEVDSQRDREGDVRDIDEHEGRAGEWWVNLMALSSQVGAGNTDVDGVTRLQQRNGDQAGEWEVAQGFMKEVVVVVEERQGMGKIGEKGWKVDNNNNNDGELGLGKIGDEGENGNNNGELGLGEIGDVGEKGDEHEGRAGEWWENLMARSSQVGVRNADIDSVTHLRQCNGEQVGEWEVAQGFMEEVVVVVEERQGMGEIGEKGWNVDNNNNNNNNNDNDNDDDGELGLGEIGDEGEKDDKNNNNNNNNNNDNNDNDNDNDDDNDNDNDNDNNNNNNNGNNNNGGDNNEMEEKGENNSNNNDGVNNNNDENNNSNKINNNHDDGGDDNHGSRREERGWCASKPCISIMGEMPPSTQWGGISSVLGLLKWGLFLKVRLRVPPHPYLVFSQADSCLSLWHRVGIG